MKVDLWFTHNGNEYHVNREIRERNSGVAHNASIEGPDVQRDGPTDTDEFIVDLFNMDASSFTNCSYVRQEDASKLIEASASDRKDMIDELLQIGVLEDYRERTHSTVVAASNVHDQKESVVDDLEDQIEEKEDGNPEQRLGDVKDSIDEVTDELDRIKSKRDEKVSEKEAIADDMAEFEDQEDELDTLREEIDDKQSELDATADDLDSKREAVDAIAAQITTTADTASEQLASLECIDADNIEELRDDDAPVGDQITVAPSERRRRGLILKSMTWTARSGTSNSRFRRLKATSERTKARSKARTIPLTATKIGLTN